MTLQSARLEIEEVPINPGQPSGTWQRLRVRDAVRDLWSRGVITFPVWLACVKFRDDSDVAAGISDAEHGIRGGGGTAGAPFSDAMLDASGRCTGAWRAVEPEGLLVRWCVMAEGTLRAFEADQGIRHGSATPRLAAALDRLADYYNQLGDRGGRLSE